MATLLAIGTPAHADRTDVLSGIAVDAVGPSGMRVRAMERDILNIVDGPMGLPQPTLNHVTQMLVHDAAGTLICAATPVVIESDLLGSTVHVQSGVSNCAADLTWSSSAPPIPDPPFISMSHILVRVTREGSVSGVLLGSSFGTAGSISRDLEYFAQT